MPKEKKPKNRDFEEDEDEETTNKKKKDFDKTALRNIGPKKPLQCPISIPGPEIDPERNPPEQPVIRPTQDLPQENTRPDTTRNRNPDDPQDPNGDQRGSGHQMQ